MELASSGLDVDAIGERIDSDAVIAALEANTQEAADRGIFGSPTMILGGQMFFGNDRIDFLKEELARLERAA